MAGMARTTRLAEAPRQAAGGFGQGGARQTDTQARSQRAGAAGEAAAGERLLQGAGTRGSKGGGVKHEWAARPRNLSNPVGQEGYLTGGFDRGHMGIDISAGSGNTDVGTRVQAAARGKIVEISRSADSYGKEVVIKHAPGVFTRYAHLRGFAKGLSEGDWVGRRDRIGGMGNTGNSEGAHLHFETRRTGGSSSGDVVNPRRWGVNY